VVDTICSAVDVDRGKLVSATPKPGWLEYLESAVRGVPRKGLVGRADPHVVRNRILLW
jgi:hypothetical protein